MTGFLPVTDRWWWTLLAATLLAGGVSFVAASTVKPTYEARVTVLVGPFNADVNTLEGRRASPRPTPSWSRRGGHVHGEP